MFVTDKKVNLFYIPPMMILPGMAFLTVGGVWLTKTAKRVIYTIMHSTFVKKIKLGFL